MPVIPPALEAEEVIHLAKVIIKLFLSLHEKLEAEIFRCEEISKKVIPKNFRKNI